jgi:hypothetical protein
VGPNVWGKREHKTLVVENGTLSALGGYRSTGTGTIASSCTRRCLAHVNGAWQLRCDNRLYVHRDESVHHARDTNLKTFTMQSHHQLHDSLHAVHGELTYFLAVPS